MSPYKFNLIFIVNYSLFLFLSSCQSDAPVPKVPTKEAVSTHVAEVPLPQSVPIPQSEFLNYKIVRNTADGLMMKAFGNIQFGVKCYSSERYPGLRDLPYNRDTLDLIQYNFQTCGCNDQVGLYAFFLIQNFAFTESDELGEEIQKVAVLVSHKYGEPLKIQETFVKGGEFQRAFKIEFIIPI